MNDEKVHEEFKRRLKYKPIGVIITLLSIIPMIVIDSLIKYVLAIIIFATGVYVGRQYKCPSCNYVFDTRMSATELIHCPKCGKRMQYC